MSRTILFAMAACVSILITSSRVLAQDSATPAESEAPASAAATPESAAAPADEPAAQPAPAPQAAAPVPAPYSLPWQLRPAIAVTVIRSDTEVAFYEDAAGNSGVTVATMLLGSYKVTPELVPFIRLGVVGNSPPTGGGATAFVNPAFGATYALKLGPEFRLAFLLGLAAPASMGGGDSADPLVAAAARSGVLTRSAMDNAMFAVNDFVVFPGVDFAWIAHGVTIQVEATLLELIRVRGEKVQPDSAKTNLTSGLHVGYFIIPQMSVGADLRYQRWLTTPAAVKNDPTGATRDNLTAALGVRFHIKLADSLWIRPGVSYGRGLDDPMAKLNYHILQLDIPLVF
ncbi:MAG: hypothetical protein GMKNLPBB_01881 [Myxococcota bacterium]|nr:hypothetical protein [Myxococcota bacterium]